MAVTAPPHAAARDAGRAALPAALTVSLLAHALALAGVLHGWGLRHEPPASLARQRGALQVRLLPPAAAVAPARPAPARPAAQPKPRAVRARAQPATHARAQPEMTPEMAPEMTPERASAAVPAAPPVAAAGELPTASAAPRPGARFASLFAPVSALPHGSARWTGARPASPPDLQRAQHDAQLALQAALHARLRDLADHLRQLDRPLACTLAVDPQHRVGELRCDAPQDQAMAWSHLQGLLSAGPVAPSSQRLCFTLGPPRVAGGECPG